MKKTIFIFIFLILFHFETSAQAPENYIPGEGNQPSASLVPPNVPQITPAPNTTTGNVSSNPSLQTSTNEQPSGSITNINPMPTAIGQNDPQVTNIINVTEVKNLRNIAVASEANPMTQDCSEFIENIDKCSTEKCIGEECKPKQCFFGKVLNQEPHTFSISFHKNPKTSKCNLKHEIKNSLNESIEFFDCQFNSLQMRQAKAYYSRFLDNKEFNFEKPVCVEPTSDGGRKIASTCEMSFDDGLKLINIFELGKKFNQCQ